MSNTKDGGPAFPAHHFDLADNEHGMTLRDYFAAKAMAGWLASYAPDASHPAGRGKAGDLAEMAYDMADAMLAARKGGNDASE